MELVSKYLNTNRFGECKYAKSYNFTYKCTISGWQLEERKVKSQELVSLYIRMQNLKYMVVA